jgi:hypothetical protein
MLPGPCPGLDGELHGFAVGQRAVPRSPELESLPFRIPAHLLEPLIETRRERLPFPLDHELVRLSATRSTMSPIR